MDMIELTTLLKGSHLTACTSTDASREKQRQDIAQHTTTYLAAGEKITCVDKQVLSQEITLSRPTKIHHKVA